MTICQYGGYRIPTGSTVFANVWGVFHDPDLYDQPEKFNPDRFMDHELGIKPALDEKEYKMLHSFQFGFGRVR